MRSLLAPAIFILIAHQSQLALGLGLSRIVPKAEVDVSQDYRHTYYIDQRIRRDAHNILNHQLYHLRNVQRSPAGPAASGTQQKAAAPASQDAAPTMPDPAPACMKALMAMKGNASNPSGMAVCYNVLMMDNTTGVFQADVRLYKISAPTGDWSTLDMNKVSTSLSYLGASVSREKQKRDEQKLFDDTHEVIEKRAAIMPQSVQNNSFIGKAHQDVLPYLNNATFQQALLTPNITLAGRIANGSTLQTQLSSKDASFVSGLFQGSTTGNTTAAAQAAAVSSAANAKFVLPGTHLGIFPIGLIITSAWAGIFISVVAYGTIGRIQFRESYRRRIRHGVAGSTRTI